MKKIEFVGGIANELAQVIDDNNIVVTCIDDNICEISEEDYDTLRKVAPAAFDSNDIIDISIEDEIMATGFCYQPNDDGRFDVCYDHEQDSFFSPYNKHHVAEVWDDDKLYYIKTEASVVPGEYPKADWTLKDAIKNQCGD